jgi:hypothetical protein
VVAIARKIAVGTIACDGSLIISSIPDRDDSMMHNLYDITDR